MVAARAVVSFSLFSLVIIGSGCSPSPTAISGVRAAGLTSVSSPDPTLTPGTLCTDTDPNFDGYRYPEQIAHCRRNVTRQMKLDIAAAYGVAEADFHLYEFDHYIPLGIGGSSDESNVWPEPLDQAKQKDVLEEQLYQELRDGQITQEYAVAQMRAWQPSDFQE
jgi:hypothetical protein